MKEQFGGIYWQFPANVSTPVNNTYVRLFRDLTPGVNFGLYFIKLSDGSIQPFNTGTAGGAMSFQGGYDASTNLYPAAPLGSGPAGTIDQGDTFVVTVGGTLGGTVVTPGDLIIARITAPGQIAGNWVLVETAGAYVPYTGANAPVDLNTQTLTAGAFVMGVSSGSSIMTLRNNNAGKQLNLVADVAGFNTLTITLGSVGSLTDFVTSGPAFSFNKDLRFDTAGISNIYVNNGGNGIHISGRNDVSGNFGITVQDNGVLQLAADTKGVSVLVAGTVTIPSTKVTATSKFALQTTNALAIGVAIGQLVITAIVPGVSFTVESQDNLSTIVPTDVRGFSWLFVD